MKAAMTKKKNLIFVIFKKIIRRKKIRHLHHLILTTKVITAVPSRTSVIDVAQSHSDNNFINK